MRFRLAAPRGAVSPDSANQAAAHLSLPGDWGGRRDRFGKGSRRCVPARRPAPMRLL